MAEWTENAYRNGCVRKRGYLTRTRAKEALRLVQRIGKAEGRDVSRLNIYKCGFCHEFHVGNDTTAAWRADGTRAR